MRELHGYHGEHRRHAHDAAADVPATRAHDGPKHAAHDSHKLRMLLEPEARRAEHLKYRQKVEGAEAEYSAKHAKPRRDQGRVAEQLKPDETAAEREDAQNEARAALAEVDNRTLPKSAQGRDVAAKQKRERYPASPGQ